MTKVHEMGRPREHTSLVFVAGHEGPAVDDAVSCDQPLLVGEGRVQVLIVDRDRELRELIAYTLQRAGLRYAGAHDTISAVELFASARPNVVILDTTDLALLEHFRDGSQHAAVIILTTGDEEDARVSALELGADDYMTKPFSPRELLARIRASLRQSACHWAT